MIFSCCMDEISDADGAILAESCDNLPKTSPIIQNTPRKRPKNSPLKPDVLQSPGDPVREGYVATFQGRHFWDDQIEKMTKTTLGAKNKKRQKRQKQHSERKLRKISEKFLKCISTGNLATKNFKGWRDKKRKKRGEWRRRRHSPRGVWGHSPSTIVLLTASEPVAANKATTGSYALLLPLYFYLSSAPDHCHSKHWWFLIKPRPISRRSRGDLATISRRSRDDLATISRRSRGDLAAIPYQRLSWI